MITGYIDSSFLLSIVFEDDNYTQSVDMWNDVDILVSSILLEIETRINVFKYYKLFKADEKLYKEKERQLKDLLQNIHKKSIDNEILLEIKNSDKLKQLKSLDSIHLSTASIFNKLIHNKIQIYTYDKNILRVAKEMGLRIC